MKGFYVYPKDCLEEWDTDPADGVTHSVRESVGNAKVKWLVEFVEVGNTRAHCRVDMFGQFKRILQEESCQLI